MSYSVLELCAGGGGQALGLELAGFSCSGVVENDKYSCQTLRCNRPRWNVHEEDLRAFECTEYKGIDLLAAGVPCPPFSVAGKQGGQADERDLFPEALRVVGECDPAAVLLENVPGFASAKFRDYRAELAGTLGRLGYSVEMRVVNASDFGIPQLRPRFVLVAVKSRLAGFFRWPSAAGCDTSVGHLLADLMGGNGWPGCPRWVREADGIGPTLVGGSKKHGGADLGPTRARAAWRKLGVDGLGIGNAAPDKEFPVDGLPRLTLRMVARLQGFPDDWEFCGGKTASYRQIGNAFPPPVAHAIGNAILTALKQRPPQGNEEASHLVRIMTDGKRLKDIADLPFDLII